MTDNIIRPYAGNLQLNVTTYPALPYATVSLIAFQICNMINFGCLDYEETEMA